MSDGDGLDKFVFGPALKATAYGVGAALNIAARAVGLGGDGTGQSNPAAPVGKPLISIRIWFKAFIPSAKVTGPPGFDICFLGDNRSFSPDRSAPARTHSEVFLNNLNSAMPTMTQTHRCGLTRRAECDTNQVIETGTAPTDGMTFFNFRYPGAEVYDWDQQHPPAANPGTIVIPATAPVSVDYRGIASDPLVPVAPMIDIHAHIEVDLRTGQVTVSGEVDEYPAFECYMLVNEQHGPIPVFAFTAADSLLAIIGGANRPFSKTISVGSYVSSG